MTSRPNAQASFGHDCTAVIVARARRTILPAAAAAALLATAACHDATSPTDPAAATQAVDAVQLQEWHERSLGLFELGGVVFTDVDEENDRLIVGVRDLRLAGRVERLAERLGIPSGAVTVQETAPIVLLAALSDHKLTDRVRPLEGGLQIELSKGICSLGFNAVREEDEEEGFVVPSHCTNTYGGLDGAEHYQPTVDPNNFIGHEIDDPEFFQCAINAKDCRHSDSAFDELAGGVDAVLGHIARPTGADDGSLEIDGSFRITAELPRNAELGQTLDKVGRTTGWTRGEVTHSCVHVRVVGKGSGGAKYFLCQDIVAASAEPGDSGSPVFAITGEPDPVSNTIDVTLHGILWGATVDQTTLVYSPIHNVERELGNLNVCDPEFMEAVKSCQR